MHPHRLRLALGTQFTAVVLVIADLRTPLIFQIAPNTFENSG
jgi:hypothetical protein